MTGPTNHADVNGGPEYPDRIEPRSDGRSRRAGRTVRVPWRAPRDPARLSDLSACAPRGLLASARGGRSTSCRHPRPLPPRKLRDEAQGGRDDEVRQDQDARDPDEDREEGRAVHEALEVQDEEGGEDHRAEGGQSVREGPCLLPGDGETQPRRDEAAKAVEPEEHNRAHDEGLRRPRDPTLR